MSGIARIVNAMQLGISTDAVRAKSQDEGRHLSQALYDGFDVDGVLYSSRLTGANCVGVYDRSVTSTLSAMKVVDLVRLKALVPALRKLNVSLVKDSEPE